jgi:hypothetical protein
MVKFLFNRTVERLNIKAQRVVSVLWLPTLIVMCIVTPLLVRQSHKKLKGE